jgi:putative NAD(P)H nitroreductase
MELKSVIESRLSTLEFDPTFEMSKSDIEKIISLNRLAPSTYNIQHTHYFVILSKPKKEAFRDKVCAQQKVVDASAIIVLMGRKNAYLDMKEVVSEKRYQLMEEYYQKDNMKTEDIIRNVSLSAMQLMLIAKDMGYDTCPMTGFDFEESKKFFNVDDEYVPVMMITLGKESANKRKRREERKELTKIATFY